VAEVGAIVQADSQPAEQSSSKKSKANSVPAVSAHRLKKPKKAVVSRSIPSDMVIKSTAKAPTTRYATLKGVEDVLISDHSQTPLLFRNRDAAVDDFQRRHAQDDIH
jgi:hypothetical protein